MGKANLVISNLEGLPSIVSHIFVFSLIFICYNNCYTRIYSEFISSFTDEIIFNRRTEAIVTKRLLALIHEINSIRENSLRSLLHYSHARLSYIMAPYFRVFCWNRD